MGAVEIIKIYVIRPSRKCIRSVYDHPVLVGILLMLLYLYASFPFLFRFLVSASPVLVCTAVLLGLLLSFGEHNNISSFVEEDEKKEHEISELKTGLLESETVVAKDESLRGVSEYTELVSEDRAEKSESRDDLVVDSVPSYHVSREVEFEKLLVREEISEFESEETPEEAVNLGDRKTGIEDDVGSSPVDRSFALDMGRAENYEVYQLAEGATDALMENFSEPFIGSARHTSDDAMDDNLENHKTPAKSIDNQMRDELESSSGSWTQFEVLQDRLSSVKKIQVDNMEDYISGEGSVDAQIGSPLELSLGSWNHLDSDHDRDDESDSGSDGAESSSPDASMADIIPMLDELHPLLEDESAHVDNISRNGSAASDDESESEEAGDGKSDEEDDNEEEPQDGKEDSVKSPINWTDEDQKNLMELGSSEMERNQRLESLIARRRARRMLTEKNLLDLEGMDLSFPIAPISTARYNPFDNAQDSYADLGLPPIPGSAPSVMVKRRNPFDLPYDSSEEKPDLTGDSFQEEFMESSQRETTNQRFFKRNETFSMGSSVFDFGRQASRATRFRPYFVPERTDSDAMSYSSFERQFSELSESRLSNSSLQRQSSDLSESKASSGADTDMADTDRDLDDKKPFEHENGQELEVRPKSDHPSDYVELGSQCSDDSGSLSGEGTDREEVDHHLPVADLIEVGDSLAATNSTSQVDYGQSDREVNSSEVRFVAESIEMNHRGSNPLSVPEDHDDLKVEDDDRHIGNNQVHDLKNIDSSEYSFEASASTDQVYEPEFRVANEADGSRHPKEPVYDSSPLAITRNPSSSSISSELQRGTSEIDLYHVQRDLFAENVSEIQDNDAGDNAPPRKEESDDDSCSANEVTEVTEHSSAGFHFTGLGQKASISLASSEAEYAFHLTEDSPKEFSHEELLGDETCLNEEEQILLERDNDEDRHADTSVADTSFEDEYKTSRDLLATLQEKEVGVLGDHISHMDSNLSSSEVELKEDIGTHVEGSEQFLPSISGMNSHDNDASKELLFSLDESHFSPHDSLIYDDPQKQGSSAAHLNLEENGQVNKVGEIANVLKVHEPEDSMFFSSLRNDESSSELEKLGEIPVSEMLDEKNAHDIHETKFATSAEQHSYAPHMADDLIMSEEINDMRDMDEELLSELDAVGDFSMKNISPRLSKSYLDAEVHSVIPEEIEADVHFINGIQFGDHTSLVDTSDIQNSDSHTKDVDSGLLVVEHKPSEDIDAAFKTTCKEEAQTFAPDESFQTEGVNEPNLAWSTESISDLHKEDVNIDFLTREDQSVENIDVAFRKLSEEEVDKSVAIEPIQLEDTDFSDLKSAQSKELISDSPSGEGSVGLLAEEDQPVENVDDALMKLVVESTEPMSQAIEAVPLLETTYDKEPVLERSESNLASPEEPESRNSVDKEMSEISGKDFEDSGMLTNVGEAVAVEALETAAESGTVSEESLPSHIETSVRDLQDSPVVEAATSDSLEHENQLESVGSIGPDSSENDIEDDKETVESPDVNASIAPAEFVDQRERATVCESETLNAGTREIHEPPVDTSIGLTRESPIAEAHISCDDEYEEQIQSVGQVETENPEIDAEFKEVQESPTVEQSVASTVDSEGHRDIHTQPQTAEIQDEKDHLSTSDPKSEITATKLDDTEGSSDVSLHSASQSNETVLGAHDSEKRVSEEVSSQVEEDRERDSHLEFSSSSSSSSSSSDSDEDTSGHVLG